MVVIVIVVVVRVVAVVVVVVVKPMEKYTLVFLDILDPSTLIAKPFCGVFLAQTFDKVVRVASDVCRKLYLVDASQDDVIRLHRVRGCERRTKKRQF